MDSIAERIFALVDELYPEQKAFALAIGETPSKVSQWRIGVTKSYNRRLPQIAEALNTTTEYLLTGNGPKSKAAAVSNSGTLSLADRQMLDAYQQAAPELQAAVRRVLGLE
ncbi:hypothetical protein [uncultured Dysosmobacter sp.]|uniref:hypothetical protein n=1 Tax=uncultured Dysosmobacter sp. TaxID=2591384 RepID=UPI002632B31A|nr:hypothetical protein [uncultured Dysosmobacter sp.]